MNLDRYSLAILAELQRDARQTVQQLSAAVGLSCAGADFGLNRARSLDRPPA